MLLYCVNVLPLRGFEGEVNEESVKVLISIRFLTTFSGSLLCIEILLDFNEIGIHIFDLLIECRKKSI